MDRRRVVITGMGTVNPLGNDCATSWEAVKKGVCGIGPITHFDTTDFKVKLAAEVKDFNPAPILGNKEARRMDRYTQLACVAAKEAILDSGLDMVRMYRVQWNWRNFNYSQGTYKDDGKRVRHDITLLYSDGYYKYGSRTDRAYLWT